MPCSFVFGGGFIVKKETLEYLRGERNATRDEFILSRERTGSAEYVYVSLPCNTEPIYKLWTKKPKRVCRQLGVIQTVSAAPNGDGNARRAKHTGGKRPYAMVMQDMADVIRDISIDSCGLLMKIVCCGCIEWHTGRVIDKRSKKPMTMRMMASEFGIGIVKAKSMLAELTHKKVFRYDRSQRAYFVERSLVKKGGASGEAKV